MNRLASETSPYLRQHAGNPVDWWPWGEEAFAEARRRDVPVLLSVGYSACHWCHVMAHESFEDADVAAVMNELFVNVKVDREERPDVDAVYMDAVQAMSGHGGWPMTVFLTPTGEPFFGGTYFPKVGRGGMPAFVDVCRAVHDAWRDRRDEVLGQAGRLTEAVGRMGRLAAGGDLPGRQAVADAEAALLSSFDPRWGGFGGAPKFPQATSIEVLLRAHARSGSERALDAVTTTLDAMASGGIYDHLGGGFARYSVDERWLVPHFEKMLYDQALLVRAYLHAWQLTGEARYLQVVEETVGYVLRDLASPGGGFTSAEDADSEGVEGKFYVWTADEVRSVLGDDLAPAALDWWGVTDEGNFEHGTTILHRPVRGDLRRPPAVEEARRRLYEHRLGRVRPGLDDKVLAEWNALFVSSLAEAGAATGRADWVAAAESAGRFLLSSMRDGSGRWLRSWQGGDARHLAYAADHAALVDAFTRLGEATGRATWITEARAVADALLERFWDDEGGGVFTTAHDAEALVVRPKDLLDNATPSANSLAAVALLRLAALTGEDRYRERAEDVLRLVGAVVTQHPTAFSHLLVAVDLATAGAVEVAVTGDRPDLVAAVQRRYLPNGVLAWGEPYSSPLWEGRSPGLAYVCRDFACRAPADSVERLEAELAAA
ncbi:MAG TPA: thioredoxin domain-containing protein [Acidimicrobiales bacterium]